MFKGSKNVGPEEHTSMMTSRRRAEQRLHDRRRDGVLGDGAGAVSAADDVARSRSHGDAADRQGHVSERARSRQGRAPDARRQSAVRPAHRVHLRQRLHHASLQAPDHRQHGRSAGGVDRGRARLLSDLLRAGERHRRGRRRFRHGAGQGSGGAVLRPRAEGGAPGAARHSAGAAADGGTSRHRARAVAAAGGGRGVPHHLRRPSGFVSAAHRLEGAVRRTDARGFSSRSSTTNRLR